MKVGDLVELSAYGKKLKGFAWLHGCRGIVIKRLHVYSVWKVYWFDKTFNTVVKRKEIKHVKAKKSMGHSSKREMILA